MLFCARNPYYVPLVILVLARFLPKEKYPEGHLKSICEYDTEKLCPECFPNGAKCEELELFHPYYSSWVNRIISPFNRHSVQIGTFAGQSSLGVMKRINRDNTIEQLLLEFCKIRSLPHTQCCWTEAGSVDHAVAYLKENILEESRFEGCIICPNGAKKKSLHRFLETFEPSKSDLWKLLLIRTNVGPLLLSAMSMCDGCLPVPKLLHSYGFCTIESYDGEPLGNFYDHPLLVRMLIGRELIRAAINFTVGINGFRIFLTDLNPDNVVVRLSEDQKNIALSIVDMDNVILVDSLADGLPGQNNNVHVHSRIECNGCFAYVQADVCSYRNSDLNLFATCQLLLEGTNGKFVAGLLNMDRTKSSDDSATSAEDNPAETVHNLLHECVYCHPPACRNRSLILENILDVINLHVT